MGAQLKAVSKLKSAGLKSVEQWCRNIRLVRLWLGSRLGFRLGFQWWLGHRREVSAVLISALLAVTLSGCASRNPVIRVVDLPDIARSKESRSLGGNIKEVAPPAVFLDLNALMTQDQPRIDIAYPKADQIIDTAQVNVKLKVRGLSIYKDDALELGPHLQVILDNQPARSVYNLEEDISFDALSPGSHTLRVLAVRPWGESFKNTEAYAQTTFHVFAKTGENTPDPDWPLLTYNQPQDTYGAEPVLLDFYLTNAPLHQLAQESKKDDIIDWKIQCSLNGQRFVFDQWEPIYIKGLIPGQNWIQLALVDENGNPIDNVFNNTVHTMTYDPTQRGPLDKIVRGELPLAQIGQIANPDYEPPTEPIEPEISDEPTKTELTGTELEEIELEEIELEEIEPEKIELEEVELEEVELDDIELDDIELPETEQLEPETELLETEPEAIDAVEEVPEETGEVLEEREQITEPNEPVSEEPTPLEKLQITEEDSAPESATESIENADSQETTEIEQSSTEASVEEDIERKAEEATIEKDLPEKDLVDSSSPWNRLRQRIKATLDNMQTTQPVPAAPTSQSQVEPSIPPVITLPQASPQTSPQTSKIDNKSGTNFDTDFDDVEAIPAADTLEGEPSNTSADTPESDPDDTVELDGESIEGDPLEALDLPENIVIPDSLNAPELPSENLLVPREN